MNCPNCNSPITPNSRFCGVCGAPIVQAPNQYDPDMSEQPTRVILDQPEPEQAPDTSDQATRVIFDEPAPKSAPAMPEQPAPQQVPAMYNQETQVLFEEPVPQQAPAMPGQPAPQQAPAAPQGEHNFNAQYQQYQQPAQYPQYQQDPQMAQYQQDPQFAQQPYGVAVKQKSKAPFIIIPIVSVLVIAGIVLGIIFGLKGCSSGSHRLVDANGVFIVEDEAINVSDTQAETKIKERINSTTAQASLSYINLLISEYGKIELYAKGNTLLAEVTLSTELTDAELATLKTSIAAYTSEDSIKSDRELYGVSDMVEVQAIVEKNGNVYYTKVYK